MAALIRDVAADAAMRRVASVAAPIVATMWPFILQSLAYYPDDNMQSRRVAGCLSTVLRVQAQFKHVIPEVTTTLRQVCEEHPRSYLAPSGVLSRTCCSDRDLVFVPMDVLYAQGMIAHDHPAIPSIDLDDYSR